ncbi:MAG: FAD:protein FMN transferase [Clostridia bacterium]|nr:FAD:protein FMN transferase [Clostridia bacterium]
MKRITAVILTVCLLLCFSSCGRNYTHTWYGEYFDTPITIGVYGVSQRKFDDVVADADELLSYWNDLLDIYNYHDGVNGLFEINASAGKSPVTVGDDLIDFIEYCIEIYDLTYGYTNIALGSVLSVWHDCRQAAAADPDGARLPSDELLSFAAPHTDIGKIVIDRAAHTVYLADESMTLDVGGTAKGYVTELLADKLISLGVGAATISLGGNAKVIGEKPDNSAWKAAIADPGDDRNAILTFEVPDGMTVVTSGSYERYYTVGGVDYCHIIDKDTMYPADEFASVSIVGFDSAAADGLSTALFCMTLDEGTALIDSLENTEAVWIDKNGNITYSTGFFSLVK